MAYQPVPGIFINPALIDGEVRIEWVPSATSTVAGTTSTFTVAGTGAPRPTLAQPAQAGHPAQDYFGSRTQPRDPRPVEIYEEDEEDKKARQKRAVARGPKRGGKKVGVFRKAANGQAFASANANAAILISDDTVENAELPIPPTTQRGKGKRKAVREIDAVFDEPHDEVWVTDNGEGSQHEETADGSINVQAGPSDRERRKSARDSKKENNTAENNIASTSTPAPPAKKAKVAPNTLSPNGAIVNESKKPVTGPKWKAALSFEERRKLIEPALRAKKLKDEERKRKKESTTPTRETIVSTLASTKVSNQNAPRSSSRRKSAAAAVQDANTIGGDGDDTVVEDAEHTGPEEAPGNKLD